MNSTSSRAGREEQHSDFVVSSREMVASGSDVQVKEFTLAGGEQVPWHRHSEMFDVFYCLEGCLNIERADAHTGTRLPGLVLKVGESAKVEPGTAHRPFNPGPGPCRFVLVQGVGKYDFIPFEPKA